MNDLQKALLKVILELSKIDEVDQFGDDLRYGFRNYVRRFALAEDKYLISKSAYQIISNHNLQKPFKRCWKNKNMNGKKYDIKYDHAVPAKEVLKLIFINRNNPKEIINILAKTNCIVILTPNEDKKLSKIYKDFMPSNWDYSKDCNLIRYQKAGIELEPDKRIPMSGALTI